ncbi:MAG: hypothetical protein JXM73_07440 [Anaerolineae bacterium]|nr:hypothetical protein [Anaerolineae bacterium]
MHKITRLDGWMALIIIAVAMAVILLSSMPAAQAASADLPPRPTRTPTPTPTPGPQPTLAPPPLPEALPAESKTPDRALVILHIQFAPPFTAAAASQLWTTVQWQDSSGSWHAVEGWQGLPDQVVGSTATKAWWLSASLLGQGPFRWAVFENSTGQRLVTSAPFSLPSRAGETLEIEVMLTP